jgi:hypothetical protein
VEVTRSEEYFMELTSGDQREIKIITRAGDRIPEFNYHISGDTLFIDNFNPNENNSNWWAGQFTIFIPEGELKGVKGKNAKLKFKNFTGAFPEIEADSSRVNIDNTSGKGILVCYLRNKSTLTVNNQIDSLFMHLNNSTLRINNRLALIQGEIVNNSTLNYKSAGELLLKQDESSVVQGNK